MRNLIVLSFLLVLSGCSSRINVPDTCSTIEACINLVKLKLQSNLIVEESWKGESVLIEFFLDDEGNVVELNVSTTTGLAELEVAGRKAVYDSSPFKELLGLPKNDYEEFKHIALTIKPYG
ncbi:cell envelope integrity protein TolA [Shewanella marisflavi]|uniref:cell envelope integrity protein TolA n=1 Tax=Shewanella marisflavi TaxID=260364 RepID=UPI00201056C7|nr:cell envelope integrity protein TolA [Shewanella marisflavi]MCL1042581.1 hypothetical protein [Shewanella marisflavi]